MPDFRTQLEVELFRRRRNPPDLAQKVGISRQYAWAIISGKRPVQKDLRDAITRAVVGEVAQGPDVFWDKYVGEDGKVREDRWVAGI